MGNARWGVVVVLLLWISCGAAPRPLTPYPPASCYLYEGFAPGWCDGRVTTLGILKRDPTGLVSFFAVDLEENDPVTRSPYLYRINCDGCPLQVGATYRARLTRDEAEQVHTILLDGTQIGGTTEYQRDDQLMASHGAKYTCLDGQTDSHWELDAAGEVACVPGPDPTEWISGDGLNVATATCSTGFPTGFVRQFGPGTPNVLINVQVSSAYDLEDPELAHEVFPQYLVDTMNQIQTGILGTPTAHPFALADGLPHLYFQATFTSDPTGDHYGMDVVVSGPKDRPTLGAGGYQAVPLFTYSVPPVYISGPQLTAAAAVGALEFLDEPGGWSCLGDVATPRRTRKEYCASNPDAAGLQASAICTIQ